MRTGIPRAELLHRKTNAAGPLHRGGRCDSYTQISFCHAAPHGVVTAPPWPLRWGSPPPTREGARRSRAVPDQDSARPPDPLRSFRPRPAAHGNPNAGNVRTRLRRTRVPRERSAIGPQRSRREEERGVPSPAASGSASWLSPPSPGSLVPYSVVHPARSHHSVGGGKGFAPRPTLCVAKGRGGRSHRLFRASSRRWGAAAPPPTHLFAQAWRRTSRDARSVTPKERPLSHQRAPRLGSKVPAVLISSSRPSTALRSIYVERYVGSREKRTAPAAGSGPFGESSARLAGRGARNSFGWFPT